jgi:hypothetical protein
MGHRYRGIAGTSFGLLLRMICSENRFPLFRIMH